MSEEEKIEEAKEKKQPEVTEVEESSAAPMPKETKPDRVKVTRMNLSQVEKALQEVQDKMGGFHSQYAQMLLGQKEKLQHQPQAAHKKAA